jgi:hypothetical protein
MSFVLLLIFAWAAAMGAWFLVSKYFKSSDLDRIKARLSGTAKTNSGKKVKGAPAQQQVINQVQISKNRFAQMIVEKSNLGPKLQEFLEQAGVPWQPARFVHTSLVLFLLGFRRGLADPADRAAAGAGGWIDGCLRSIYLRPFQTQITPEAF